MLLAIITLAPARCGGPALLSLLSLFENFIIIIIIIIIVIIIIIIATTSVLRT